MPMLALGGIAPTHSQLRHKKKVEWSASRPVRALPPGKGPPVSTGQEAKWAPEPVWLEQNPLHLSGIEPPIVQPVAGRYTDWDTQFIFILM